MNEPSGSTSGGYCPRCGAAFMPDVYHQCYPAPYQAPQVTWTTSGANFNDWTLQRIATALERIAAALETDEDPSE